MAARRAPLERLPHWPRLLSREEAARYVGVSATLFDREVGEGKWPRLPQSTILRLAAMPPNPQGMKRRRRHRWVGRFGR